jgi:hypothetical protein
VRPRWRSAADAWTEAIHAHAETGGTPFARTPSGPATVPGSVVPRRLLDCCIDRAARRRFGEGRAPRGGPSPGPRRGAGAPTLRAVRSRIEAARDPRRGTLTAA